MAPLPPGAPIGVYIHIPFCAHICPYCDFNTYSGIESLIPRYVDAVCREIEQFPARFGSHEAATIFFGGGTPSLLPVSDIARVITAVRSAFELQPDLEVTIEANPNHFDGAYCDGLLRSGVNRISLGAQTFDRRGLRTLGRQHEAIDVVSAMSAAREAGFQNISGDFIFGWPGQSLAVWRSDLDRALAADLGLTHLSLYSLIIEPGTPMAEAVARGVLVPLSDDAAADCYDVAVDLLTQEGWNHYEIANFARSTAFRSLHNMIYWRNGAYAGFGAGAHWRIGSQRRMNHLLPRTYIEAVEQDKAPISNSEEVNPRMSRGETMMLGLRLLEEGITDTEFAARHGETLESVFQHQLRDLSAKGLLEWDGGRARLTTRGMMLANDVCAAFL